MRQIKHIFIIMILAAFTFNATAGFASGMCGCDHKETQIMEMPCHDSEKAESVTADNNQQDEKTATCTMCKCGHCKSHSHMSLQGQRATQEMVTSTIALMPHSDVITSLIIYGIDNPPKHIS